MRKTGGETRWKITGGKGGAKIGRLVRARSERISIKKEEVREL